MTSEPHEILAERLKATTLCALPQSAVRLIQLSKNPQNGPKELAVPISIDMGLSTQVLRFVNSSFFGFRYKITSIPLAISMASIRTIRNFVLWSGLFAMMPNPKCGPFSLNVLFQDAIRRAAFVRQIAQMMGNRDPEELFLSAILQDMSIPILGKIWNVEYTEMISECDHSTVRLSQLERERMGWDHGEASEILTNHWNLDDKIGKIIASHTSSDFSHIQTEEEKNTATIALSSLLPSVIATTWHEAELFLYGYNQVFLGQTPDLSKIFEIVDLESSQLMQLVNLGNMPKSLMTCHQEYVNSIKHPSISTEFSTDSPIPTI